MRIGWLAVSILAMTLATASGDEHKAKGLPPQCLQQRAALPKARLWYVPLDHIKQPPKCLIEDEVCIDGFFYRFLVRTPHGDYDVISLHKLGKTLGEAEVIEKYRATAHGSQAWKGAKDSVDQLGEGLKNLVTSPLDSIKAIGRSFARMGRAIANLAKKPFQDDSKTKAGDGTDRSRGAQGFLCGDELRKFAFELGVDVYSDNVYLQALMREVAKRRAAGRIAANLGMSAIALGNYASVLQGALTPGGIDAQSEAYIRDNDPEELKRINKRLWDDQFKLEKDNCNALQRFLDNPNFTPRESTYARVHLAKMRRAAGVYWAVSTLAAVKMPAKADALVLQLELLAAYSQNQCPVNYLIPIKSFIAGRDKQGTIVLIMPHDILGYSNEMNLILSDLCKAGKQQACKVEVWGTGIATAAFVQAAKSYGIKVEQRVLVKPCFNVSPLPVKSAAKDR